MRERTSWGEGGEKRKRERYAMCDLTLWMMTLEKRGNAWQMDCDGRFRRIACLLGVLWVWYVCNLA